ncbi:hypothetical protein EH31_14520 [Erythrobacter longus]|uniref:Autotransporter domain-containing protein n=1 Tax=Erythrobacter longus TaxID=1044 RepID=A0A074M768_ERYLO|nr:hypothetical protein [Erythrobacter longus]KEO89239.1 hypothetical protein EH31_14520 [Erythrobacter longus]
MSKKHSIALTQSSALALATGLAMAATPAEAQLNDGSFQANGTIIEGSGQIIQDIDLTEVIVESDSVVIDWAPFDDFGSGDIDFQPFGTTAIFRDDGIVTDFAVLNRILPTDLSRRVVFDGTVISEIQGQVGGTVFFYSPGGILVGSNAVFDVGNLGLTTAEPVTDGFGNFILGDTVTFAQSDPTASITIDPGASIFADQNQGSYVALFAPSIVNRGGIFVDGQAALVGGEAGTITFSPDGLFDIQVSIGSEFATPIENTGVIGGGASLDGSSRVYMVAISKNNAATIAISGGSSLGFDVANSAFMDGDTVVLSAGFNVTAGQIESAEASDGIIDITSEDTGFGGGVSFTSSVVGQAASDVILNVRDTLGFEGNATFSGRQVLATLDANVQTGTFGNLVADGDLTLLADRARIGADVGNAQLSLFSGSLADITGNLQVSSIATADGDGNGNGIALASNSGVLVTGPGSQLNVGGDLIAESLADLFNDPLSLRAQSSGALITAENQGSITVGGVTRVRSEAIAGLGGIAQSAAAELFARTGGTITTGELNIASRALGGDGDAMGLQAGDAIGSVARINSSDAGSAITVLNANTIGDPATGELAFLFSEAIGGTGISGNGGNASTADVDLGLGVGALLSLPNVPGNPMTIINRAVGGDTLATEAFGGDATIGRTFFQVFGGTHNLGRVAFLTQAIGGSAAPGVALSNGGNSNSDLLLLNFFDTITAIAIDEVRREAFGGNASDVQGGFAGGGSLNTVELRVTDSELDIGSDLDISQVAIGGIASENGGFASTGQIGVFAQNSVISVAGDATLTNEAIGGVSLNEAVFDPGFAYLEQGGGASSGQTVVSIDSTQINVAGVLDLGSFATGGSARSNLGGNADAQRVFVALNGTTAPSIITANEVLLTSSAEGGSIDSTGNPNSFGTGGNATSGGMLLSFFGGDNLINADVSVLVQSDAGDSGLIQGNGGVSNTGNSSLVADGAGSPAISGNWVSQITSLGGDAPAGFAGNANSGFSEIFAPGGDITITGDASLSAIVEGGDGQTGGNATGSFAQVNPGAGRTIQIGGTLALFNSATGGDGTLGTGGTANSGSQNAEARQGGAITIGNAIQFGSVAVGGNSTNNRGGDAAISSINIGAVDAGSSFTVQGNDPQIASSMTTQAIGGTGGAGTGANGGSAQGGFLSIGAFNDATLTLTSNADPFLISQLARGGDTLGNDALAGEGSQGGISINVNSSTANLGNLEIRTEAFGGSALPGAQRSAGGNVFLGSVGLSFNDADVDVAFSGITIDGVGGDGSGDEFGVGGSAQFGDFSLNVTNTALDIPSELVVQGTARGGNGWAGGDATAPGSSPFLENTIVNIADDLIIDLQATGGLATGAGQAGGSASGQPFVLDLVNSTLAATGSIAFEASTTGGDAQDGDGGSATTSRVDVNISGGSTISATGLLFDGNAVGGSALGQGIGNGGDAFIDPARLNYTFDGTTNVATVDTDVIFASSAQGGNAAAGGGDGGNATAGNGEIYNFTSGTIAISGGIDFFREALGGTAASGIGGSAAVSETDVIAFSGGSLLVDGGLTTTTLARGGDGQAGGDATGGSSRLLARGTLTLGEGLIVNEQVQGGNALASPAPGTAPGAGGNALAGSLQILGGNEATVATSQLTLPSIEVTSSAVGGNGGAGLGGADGGVGGNATGLGGTVLGQAINGILQVNGATRITANATGGQGGTGANGGDGGRASGGFLQIGTSSGGEVPNPPEGSATFTTLDVVNNAVGGNGGSATASGGVGGTGGEAIGGNATLLVRGALVTADSATYTLNGTGGNGGSGSVQGSAEGNGGDGAGGNASLLISEAFTNPGRGAADIGALVINSAGQGGLGAVAGSSEFANGGQLTIEQSDVTIGSITVNLAGDNTPDFLVDDGMGGQVPVPVNPFAVIFTDGANIDFGSITITTPGDVSLVNSGSAATGDVFDIDAGGFAPSTIDTSDPAFVPGVINAASSLVLTSATGHILADTQLATPGDLILNSFGGITTRGLTGGSIFLTLGTGGALDVTSLTASGGGISIEAQDDLATNGNIDAASVLLRSINGTVSIDSAVSLSGDLVAQAALGVNVDAVSAQNVTLTTAAGDIVATGLVTASDLVDLDAGGSIDAQSLIASNGVVDLDALGSVSVANVDALSIIMRAQNGNVAATGALTAEDDIDIEGSGGVAIQMASARTLGLRSLLGNVSSGGQISVDNAANIAANGDVALAGVDAGALGVSAAQGNISVNGSALVDSAANFDAAAGAVTLGEVTAGSILANAGGGAINAGPLNAAGGDVVLNASSNIDLESVDADTLNAVAQGGNITAGPINAGGGAFLEAGTALILGDVTAGIIIGQAAENLSVNGTWQAPVVALTTPALDFGGDGFIDTGSTGQITINSTNPFGVLVGANDGSTFDGLALDLDRLERLTAGNLDVTALGAVGQGNADAATIRLGDLDVTGLTGLADLAFFAGDAVAIEGAFTSSGDLRLRGQLVTLNTEAGRINLGTDGTALTVDAGTFIVGDASVLDGFNAGLSIEDAQALVNAPATAPIEGGVITAGSIILDVGAAAVIQNTGTTELPEGFVIGSPEGLTINSTALTGESTLVILNGQVAGANGANLTGNEAAEAIFAALGDNEGIASGSQINACNFVTCDDVPAAPNGTGELTSSVSASVNGAISAGASGRGSTASTRSGASGDAGSDNAEERSSTGTSRTASNTGTRTASGDTITIDDVDDGGDGPGEFDIEDVEEANETDVSDENEASEEAGDEVEDTEDTEDDSEEEAEEEGSEEEEESEGPTTGPINAPPSIIDTNALEQRGTINDPISGSGNPALLDPDVTVAPTNPEGGQ